MRSKPKKGHPWKVHCPEMFKKHSEPIDEYWGEKFYQNLQKSMHKSARGNGGVYTCGSLKTFKGTY